MGTPKKHKEGGRYNLQVRPTDNTTWRDKQMGKVQEEKLSGLRELTGQESGVVIYGDKAIICNWTCVFGYPRLLAPLGILGLGEEIDNIKGKSISGKKVAEMLDDVEIIYDRNDDFAALLAGEYGGIVYRLPQATVIAPERWN